MGPAQLSCLKLTKFAMGEKKKYCPDPGSSDKYFQKRLATCDIPELTVTVQVR